MWLLNAITYKLEEFYEPNVPPYAILSHRWQADETKFKNAIEGFDSNCKSQGQHKVISCCHQAITDGLRYVWIDTCCINKESSAELSEAINSMYRWYKAATVCYAYLFDVDGLESLESSTWFTRSWTLQEFLAPVEVIFFDMNWQNIGKRSDDTICQRLACLTRIPDVAINYFDPDAWCVAEKMSWASKRSATRTEDIAYSLLGLFDVNMPLLYGEGDKAFFRLQQEIMQTTRDGSLFFWSGESSKRFGMLAAGPASFDYDLLRDREDIEEDFRYEKLSAQRGYTVNNAGMSIELFLQPLYLKENLQGIYAASLTERILTYPTFKHAYFFLEQQEGSDRYHRVLINGRAWELPRPLRTTKAKQPRKESRHIMIRKKWACNASGGGARAFAIEACPKGPVLYRNTPNMSNLMPHQGSNGWTRVDVPPGKEHEIRLLIDPTNAYGVLGCFSWEIAPESQFLVAFIGFDFDYNPICLAFMLSYKPGMLGPMDKITEREIMSNFASNITVTGNWGKVRDGGTGLYCFRGERCELSLCSIPDLALEVCFQYTSYGEYRVSFLRDSTFGENTYEAKSE